MFLIHFLLFIILLSLEHDNRMKSIKMDNLMILHSFKIKDVSVF